MDVIAVDQFTTPAKIIVPIGLNNNIDVEITPTTDLQSVLGKLDYISLHVPKQADGSAVITASEFSKMKKA